MNKQVDIWYFSTTDRKLRHGDNRVIRTGRTHKVSGPIVLCENGLHGSRSLLDALEYAPGPVLWRGRLSGEVVEGKDKLAASERTYLASIDTTDILHEFVRKCALRVAHLWDMPEVVRNYLQTGDKELRAAARAATKDANEDAWDACEVAWDAWNRRGAAARTAKAAARAAARDAGYAARDAGYAARTALMWADAGDNERQEQENLLIELLQQQGFDV